MPNPLKANAPSAELMSSPAPLAVWLTTVAPKQLLQKALLAEWAQTLTRVPWSSGFCPPALSQLQVDAAGNLQYESAIAHPLAALLGTDAPTLASRLATEFTAYSAQPAPTAIATGLSSVVNPASRLTFTLAAEGWQSWLHHWLHSPCPELPLAAANPHPDASAHFDPGPLCGRLQLSLPMLLQWADARCQRWQAVGEWSASSHAVADAQRGDAVVRGLLPTVMHSLDQLAESPAPYQTGLRVGYDLAAWVYELDAKRAGERSQATAVSPAVAPVLTLMATQKVLRLVLATTFRQSPSRAF